MSFRHRFRTPSTSAADGSLDDFGYRLRVEALLNDIDHAAGLRDPALSSRLVELAVEFDSAGGTHPWDRRLDERARRALIGLAKSDRLALGDRWRRPVVFHTDARAIGHYVLDVSSAPGSWKPVNALWSSPQVTPGGESAWTFRAHKTRDAKQHHYRLVAGVDITAQTIVTFESLQAVDDAVERYGGRVAEMLIDLCDRGVRALWFPWSIVFEAELAVLHGERSRESFPVGLGVESTLWLTRPTVTAACVVPNDAA
jgi:hypothetical protein